MLNQVKNIEKNELENFIKKAKGTKEFKLIVSKLIEDKKIASENFEVEKAHRLENSEFKIAMLTLAQDNVKVVFYDTGAEYNFTVREIRTRDEKEVSYIYKVLDNDFVLIKKAKYENVLKGMEMLNNSTLPEKLTREEITANISVPCIYGNWCGPGCSGPDDPIDGIDTCCMYHDNCYGRKGYFDCGCNEDLKYCLEDYVAEGSIIAKAIVVTFKKLGCIQR